MQAPPTAPTARSRGATGVQGPQLLHPLQGQRRRNEVRFCRHYAAGLYFRRWDGQWYLEINPTYHFTIDGRRESLFDAEYVKKIKRLERNNAVYQLVRAWADYLQGEDTLFSTKDERIRFGRLLELDCDAAIDETVWIPQKPAAGRPTAAAGGTMGDAV